MVSRSAEVPGVGPEGLPVPLYEHVKRQIAEAILIGELAPGTVLPGEIALATQYGVAVGTIRRALADLTAGGMLMRRRKTGTVVTGRASQHGLRFFFQYFRLQGADGSLLQSEAEVLSVAIEPATTAEAALFGVPDAEPLLRLHRVRRVARAPILHSRIVLVASRIPGFPLKRTKVPALLYRHLLEAYGIRISAVREKVAAELANNEDCRLLKLTSPSAVLVINEEAYDQTGALAICSQHRATTANHHYSNEIR
ncbi:putative transcriptional regulatory protein [Bradyrhizobium sp. STM 3843]|uniref:GntR family transcriptional regulator n=1 Tax=Bradyrhizobium sp. STM 3843 TaxID=551947 RepID=UPI000240A844|nr:GntR family transcriptional regulator [Bradyrhizobium sp. STM 3843]CCE04258.1 putative transcriptional regulatory protein [Bradyrhizobium sp. STM 3843]